MTNLQTQQTNSFMENAHIMISEYTWSKHIKSYRKWYQNYFGKRRSPIKSSLDFMQVISYIKSNNLIFPLPNKGTLVIELNNGTNQIIDFHIHR